MIAAIAAAEVAFWVVLLGGLVLRYVARRQRLSSLVLLALPLVDLLLLVFVAVDLARGAEPTRSHALAAVYLGATVAFGHPTIRWADARFRHRFAGGPKPTKPPKGSRAAVRAEWVEWFRVVALDVVAVAVLLVLAAVGGVSLPSSLDEVSTSPYWSTIALLGIVTVIWFLAGPAFSGRGRDDEPTGQTSVSS